MNDPRFFSFGVALIGITALVLTGCSSDAGSEDTGTSTHRTKRTGQIKQVLGSGGQCRWLKFGSGG